jgi:hypothetical protein
MRPNKKWWLNNIQIIGFDGPGEGTGQQAPEGGTGEGQGTGEGTGEGTGQQTPEGTGEQSGKTYTEAELGGLKSALAKEREDRKALDKELATFRKAKQTAEDAEKSEVQRLTDQQQRNADKLQKLSDGYRKAAIDRAITEAAKNAKFRDPSDALRPEILSAISVEQDEDDPTQVTIDTASLNQAIKELAKNKPHYLVTGQPQGTTRSGSTFGGSSNGGNNVDAERARLMSHYPALKGRS